MGFFLTAGIIKDLRHQPVFVVKPQVVVDSTSLCVVDVFGDTDSSWLTHRFEVLIGLLDGGHADVCCREITVQLLNHQHLKPGLLLQTPSLQHASVPPSEQNHLTVFMMWRNLCTFTPAGDGTEESLLIYIFTTCIGYCLRGRLDDQIGSFMLMFWDCREVCRTLSNILNIQTPVPPVTS